MSITSTLLGVVGLDMVRLVRGCPWYAIVL